MDGKPLDILLVEDNPNDAELSIRALNRNAQRNILVVRDGVEAIDYLFATGSHVKRNFSELPKAVMLDLKLPKISGLEVLEKIKSSAATRWIPVIMLTSSQESRDIESSYKLGVNSYVVKPVEFDKFMQAVSETGDYWLNHNTLPY